MVDVSVTFTCPVGSAVVDHGQGIYLQEAISRTQQASGNGGLPDGAACTGAPQTAVARVLANASGPPFRLGSAVALGNLFACDPNFVCVNATSGYSVIKIHR